MANWIPCVKCQLGKNGNQTCSSRDDTKNIKLGCFDGIELSNKEVLEKCSLSKKQVI